ncbi:MAG: insulinase family protein [Labilithrix sp.]|nr:insulinase family protein [Labilithrix sp.]MCW5814503.1 insulinase family protein [Labilithrix sp.]
MRFSVLTRVLVAGVFCAGAATAQPAKPAPAKPAAPAPAAAKPAAPTLSLDVKKAKLDNGLRVVMLVDHTAPTVAVDVVYDVGGRNEERGRSGFAHLFEHMMFQGSANVPRGDHFKLVTAHGGTLNGTTSEDRTNYFEMLPSSELALGLWLEADRMKSLDVSLKNFENQRAVVKEEYRMRVENAAYVPADIRLQELTFQGYWPYEHSAIGTMKDLDAAQLDWVRAFHKAYYAPNNAVLAIAGDFDEAEALALAKKYFGDAKPTEVPKYEPGPLPEQTAPRNAVVEDTHAKLPALLYGWTLPPSGEPDNYAVQIAGDVLGDGESSRLYRVLVRERGLAVEVDQGVAHHRGPDMFELTVKLASGAKVADVQKVIDAQIAELAKNGPTDDELKKVRARTQSGFILGLESNIGRANKLAEFELYRGDASLLNKELDKYLAVSKDDVKRVVTKYLTANRRSLVEVKPAAPENKAEKK